MTDAERVALVTEIAEWLRHIDRLDEIPGARVPGLARNPLWDASFALEARFGAETLETSPA